MAEMRDYHSGGPITAAPLMPLAEKFDVIYGMGIEPITYKPSTVAAPVTPMPDRGGHAAAGNNYMVWEEVGGYVILRVAKGSFHAFTPDGVSIGTTSTLMQAQYACSGYRQSNLAASAIVSVQDAVRDFNTKASATPKSKPEPKPTPEDYGGW